MLTRLPALPSALPAPPALAVLGLRFSEGCGILTRRMPPRLVRCAAAIGLWLLVARARAAPQETGSRTVRAVRLSTPLRVDGVLDEEIYRAVPPITGFIQMLPQEGQPASEETEAWVL